jgi:hypothetical protein
MGSAVFFCAMGGHRRGGSRSGLAPILETLGPGLGADVHNPSTLTARDGRDRAPSAGAFT